MSAPSAFLAQHFEKAGALAYLALVPALVILLVCHFYYRYPGVKRLLGRSARGDPASAPSALPRRYVLSNFFFLAFVACSVAALAAPRAGTRLAREARRGADIALAYDISRSMDIRDCETAGAPRSRLERGADLGRALVLSAGREAREDRALIPADIHVRYALALGKGAAVLAVPLTSDSEAVLALLDALSPSASSSRGTNLEALVDAAAGAFNDDFSTAKVIILFSDGEALSGSLAAAAERARENGVTLYAVGLGSLEGAPPGPPAPEEIVSALRPEALAAAARAGGGHYVDGNASSAPDALRDIRARSGGSSWNFREEFVPVWHLFTLAGLAALLLSKLCVKRPRPLSRPRRPPETP